jgi:hypothetical protein
LDLKYYRNIQKVFLPQEAVHRAQAFADAVTNTTNYTDSQQFSQTKINTDHFISKLGEEAAHAVLKNFVEVSLPDYTIYHGKAKSWAHDLFVNGTGIAVKTQSRSSAKLFGLSWTFQCGLQRRDTILDDPEAWVLFVAYDDTLPFTCYVYPPYQLKELILGEPRLEKLKGSKKVVYATSLPNHINKRTV